jgi:hypothetical protein
MELLNIFNNKKVYVNENLGTKGALVGDIIINRIGKIDDHYELLGPSD